MEKYRRSKLRNRILEILRETGSHPHADWVYDKLKKEYPRLSLGSVYRNLSILTEQGMIRKIDFGSSFDRFDANTTDHYHFICENCGSIIDLKLPIDKTLEDRVNQRTNFKTKNHKIQFYGICENCINP
jgi:Fur family peroxide stress response transcriptional regulator